jgi:uncharacterized protein YbjT (DUF2867 family)
MEQNMNTQQQRIAVAGGTGRLGRHVVDVLRERGHDVVPMSRTTGVDVVTGQGLDEALRGVHTVIDAATGPSPDEKEANDFFRASAHNLHTAGQRAGVGRLVVVSIIGIDRMGGGGYQGAKRLQEQLAVGGPVPVTILRASQFHEFVEELVHWGTTPEGVAYVPPMRTQVVAARAVAEALADLVEGGGPQPSPSGAPAEIAGPREERLVELGRLLAARRLDGLRVEEQTESGVIPDADAVEAGALLPSPHAVLAGPTFTEWLDAQVASAA